MEKILVIQTAFIGDAILTLPMVQMLKKESPSSQIDVLSNPKTKEIFLSSPFVNNVFVLDKKNEHKSFISLYLFSKILKKEKYDLIYSPHRSTRTALLTNFCKAQKSYTFSNSSFKFLYKNIIHYDYSKHEIQRNFDLISFNYNEDTWKIIPEIKINEKSKYKVDNFFINCTDGKENIAIAPGSVWDTKRYPITQFIEIIKLLLAYDFKIYLIGGKEDESICKKIADGFGENVESIAGKFTIVESIEFLKKIKLLITNDSAPTHMGVCANISVLTLYCSTVPKIGFYPYNKKSSYLSYDDLSCKPCGVHGLKKCPIKTFDCAKNLSPKIVVNKAKELLDARN